MFAALCKVDRAGTDGLCSTKRSAQIGGINCSQLKPPRGVALRILLFLGIDCDRLH